MEHSEEVAVVVTEQPAESTCAFDQKACDDLFALAKRNLVCAEVPTAVNQLQDVCKQLATKYGETAPECAEAYFQYGVALMELARMENRVLGYALQGMSEDDAEEGEDNFAVPTVMTEEEKEEISEQVIDAMLESDSAVVPEKSNTAELKTGEDTTSAEPVVASDAKSSEPAAANELATASDVKAAASEDVRVESSTDKLSESPVEPENVVSAETKKETTDVSKTSDETTEDQKANQNDGEKDDEEEEEDMDEDEAVEEGEDSQPEDEEVSNLQLSWEMLELAKTIYRKQETKEAKLKSAECLNKLGEVGLETEQYTQSIEDFNASVEILKSCVDDVTTDRRLAETHYHIGVACVYAQRYDDAVTQFRAAITILDAKIVALNVLINAATETADVQEVRKELKEIEELIPEIKVKIDDAEEEKRSVIELKKETACLAGGNTTTGFEGESSTLSASSTVNEIKPVSDVSHLVRKKRKPEDDVSETEGNKKPKTSEVECEVVSESDKLSKVVTTDNIENVQPSDESKSLDIIESGNHKTNLGKVDANDAVAEDVLPFKSITNKTVEKEVEEPVKVE